MGICRKGRSPVAQKEVQWGGSVQMETGGLMRAALMVEGIVAT